MEVVERGQQLAVRQIAGAAEDDERHGCERASARLHGVAAELLAQRREQALARTGCLRAIGSA